jgi:hypothetical protein
MNEEKCDVSQHNLYPGQDSNHEPLIYKARSFTAWTIHFSARVFKFGLRKSDMMRSAYGNTRHALWIQNRKLVRIRAGETDFCVCVYLCLQAYPPQQKKHNKMV